jgi:hypothetical protein
MIIPVPQQALKWLCGILPVNFIKMTVQDIIGIRELQNPWQTRGTAVSIVWLEKGDQKAGLGTYHVRT